MSKSASAPSAPLSRKQASRVERERRQKRLILGVTAAVAVLVIGVIAAGIIDQTVLRPRQPVARVGAASISRAEFVKAAKFQRYQLIRQYIQIYQTMQVFGADPQSQQYFTQQLQQVVTQLNDSTTLGQEVVDGLVDDQLIRQESARRGITVSSDEIERAFRDIFNYYPDGTPTPTITPTPAPTEATSTPNPTVAAILTAAPTITPTATLTTTTPVTPTNTPAPTATTTPGPSPTPAATSTPPPTATPVSAEGFATELADFQSTIRQDTGMSDSEIRRLLESQLYRERLSKAMADEVAQTSVQAHVRHILVADEVLAQDIAQNLRAGEDFAVLAAQYSTDSSNKADGGDLGWISIGEMVTEFDLAAFNQPVGEIGGPVKTTFGFHIVQVLERGDHALSPAKLEQARSGALQAWLTAQRSGSDASGKAVVELFDNWQADVPTDPQLPSADQAAPVQ